VASPNTLPNLVRELQLHGSVESSAYGSPSAQEEQVSAQPQPLLTVEQAAAYLGMSAKWVYRNYRRLAPILIGDGPKPRIRFRRCDLDAWVCRHWIRC
jgi:predicted DNA-binding transcriptional regulator AlpA